MLTRSTAPHCSAALLASRVRCRYRDFFRYTRDKLGDDRLIMSRRPPALCPPALRCAVVTHARRPVDNFGPIYLSFSPRDVVFAGCAAAASPIEKL